MYPHQYNPANDNLDISGGVNEYTDSTIGERATYDENGNVLTYTDSFGKTTVNTYDSQNHLVKSVSGNEITRFVYNGGDNLLQVIYPDQYNPDDDNLNLSAESPVDTYANSAVGDRYTYDADGRVLTYTNRYGCVTTNTYDSEGNLTSTARSDGTLYTFDKDGKIEKETFANGLVRNFAYTSNQTVVTGSNGVTATYNMNAFGEVSEYKLQNGESNKSYSYTYDSDGNITSISLNGSLRQRFSYNWSKELSRVDDAVANKSVTYGYDYVGNIIEIRTYAYSSGDLSDLIDLKRYTYDSQNRRTDLGYDANGNINEFNGNALIWSGRRLTEVADVNNSILYTYNHNGIRTSKNVNGVVVNYTVDENNNITEQTDGTNTMKFVYDSSGSPVYFIYNDTTYYYEKNLQGDIVAILDGSGNTVVEYSYDIWGKLLNISGTLTTSVGAANPLRYRGYYYDSETGFYYLQSRYYSPDLMRFISQDDPVFSNAQGEPLGSNLYVYCLNNPVIFSDSSGTWISFKKAYNNLRRTIAYSNYNYNRHYDKFKSYISGQGVGTISRLKFGFFRMYYNGCEVIAIYNALWLRNRRIPISEIAFEMEVNGASTLFGVFGSNPYFIGFYLNAHKVKFNMELSVAKLYKYKKENGVYIISFWTGKMFLSPIHTVAVQYRRGKFVVYNRYDNLTDLYSYYSFESIFKSGRFIVGYYLK